MTEHFLEYKAVEMTGWLLLSNDQITKVC